ncbi:MAG: hypothetical protein M1823_004173 [Watsoniomyces obsoletus]|nr:MAG: hypothetical protein M1823_004173 [Watsoniomyces obsoletus]
MFTGIIEVLGTVFALEQQDNTLGGGGTTLTISDASSILTDAHEGDSISVNGTCLTITSFTPHSFTVGVAPETLRRTNLGSLTSSSSVNLERSISATTRMGGHFVQGHVDTIATILSVTPDGNALTFRLQPREKGVLKYIVEKGYVALDGASLTVTNVNDDVDGVEGGWFEIMLIEYTQSRVVMATKKMGGEVNVEVDMLGKYVEKSVKGFLEGVFAGEEKEGKVDGGGYLERIVRRIVEEKGLDGGKE